MSGGSKKAEKTKVSEGEKISAQLARDQIGYYRSTFAPLEGQFRDLASQNHSERFAGQNATAAMREMTPALGSIAQTGIMADTADMADGVTSGRVAGYAQGRRERDDGRLEALGVGLGISADATRSLATAGHLQTQNAVTHMREKTARAQAKADTRNAALGAIAAVGGAYGTKSYLTSQQRKAAFDHSVQMGSSVGGYHSPEFSAWVRRQNTGGR